MKSKMLMSALIGLAAFGVTARALQSAETSHSVWDGVYTAVQSSRGKAQYTSHCASCHGDMLQGSDTAPALSGKMFLYNWNSLHLEDLVERIQTDMPADNPGSLSRKTVADITAYILSVNQFPAGTAELSDKAEILQDILIDAKKP